MNKCPSCGSITGVREIIYGFPIEPINDNTYFSGGCCITNLDPTKICRDCEHVWDFISRPQLT